MTCFSEHLLNYLEFIFTILYQMDEILIDIIYVECISITCSGNFRAFNFSRFSDFWHICLFLNSLFSAIIHRPTHKINTFVRFQIRTSSKVGEKRENFPLLQYYELHVTISFANRHLLSNTKLFNFCSTKTVIVIIKHGFEFWFLKNKISSMQSKYNMTW